jgi:hypothetical protein
MEIFILITLVLIFLTLLYISTLLTENFRMLEKFQEDIFLKIKSINSSANSIERDSSDISKIDMTLFNIKQELEHINSSLEK